MREVAYKYPGAQPVVVVDVRMSFWSMVFFMVKWALASIPAIIILLVIGWIIVGIVGFFAGVGLSSPPKI
ncbi:hypothetical protein [Aquipseudomonas campi]